MYELVTSTQHDGVRAGHEGPEEDAPKHMAGEGAESDGETTVASETIVASETASAGEVVSELQDVSFVAVSAVGEAAVVSAATSPPHPAVIKAKHVMIK